MAVFPHLPLQVILMIGIGGAVGVVGGGIVGQLLYNRNKRSMPIFIGAPWGRWS